LDVIFSVLLTFPHLLSSFFLQLHTQLEIGQLHHQKIFFLLNLFSA
jgi:hypothetical protein